MHAPGGYESTIPASGRRIMHYNARPPGSARINSETLNILPKQKGSLDRSKVFTESDRKNEMELIAYCLEIIGRNKKINTFNSKKN
jgi:hypothetical protein